MSVKLERLLQAKLFDSEGQEITLQEIFRKLNLELNFTENGWWILKDLNFPQHANIVVRRKHILKIKSDILRYINKRGEYYTNKETSLTMANITTE